MNDSITDRLRASEDGVEYEEAISLLEEAATALDDRDELLKILNEFVGQYRSEFEENLTYEQQEAYREYFDLGPSRDDGEILGEGSTYSVFAFNRAVE